MSESDDEFNLLDLDQTFPEIGEHELKTSPLVTKDASSISERFSQKGLLGTVISVHADGLPEETIDPRIYLNLDAPSSGLVCGVQGSGKSHTVSCILESSLMVNRQIGTLPAPLGTVVFHFDEENGERPCEAAYLSEMKDASLGVKEVVVLVSPSNLKTRRRIYSGLKYVRVEPLRIVEQDLNAARMLSMMGAENLENLPLYMQTLLSILREIGSDDFTYRAFQKRLKNPEFNRSQGAMLQLRLELLDSFLKGNGPDVTSFFKPGRLVIIDISDPFIESTTAAMLFNICLGLFIEWKSSTGKLIGESLCSIIRQQRHLAARVIISTQEPTVVPSSVLGLLSWVMCHRFSSPGWVRHLKGHICTEEEKNDDQEGNLEWGKRVMTLRTGEALLYSPASLFATATGQTATLSTGYAITKTRSRLTGDGGASLLATDALSARAIPTSMGIPTPPPSPKTPVVTTSSGDTGGVNVAQLRTTYQALLQTMNDLYHSDVIQPDISTIGGELNKSKPPPYDGKLKKYLEQAHNAGVITMSGKPDSIIVKIDSRFLSPKPLLAAKDRTSGASSSGLPDVTPSANLKNETSQSTIQPTIPSGPSNQIPLDLSSLHNSYGPLIEVMKKFHDSNAQPGPTHVREQLKKFNPPVFTGKPKAYLRQASRAGVITMAGKGKKIVVKLAAAFFANAFPFVAQPQVTKPSPASTSDVPPVMNALLEVVAQEGGQSKKPVLLSGLASVLTKHKHGDFKQAGYKKFTNLVEAAEKQGLVVLTGASVSRIIRLK
ncbi:hypothetical protein M408DRAFT_29280 [Serendipita vermifera MAFF 305830]|uniref:Uncharacterized protein n=1 Tax=Serendipita vermifera MAFF 305830 TaxID=933852 RepID=A0A0C3ANY2_SERVB|nr:hypothetical protein M408DRAFT_29280 [Serendipita vermifera MAFF 305830]